MLFLTLICVGAGAGVITKAATLYMASRGATQTKRALARTLGIFLIPSFFITPYLYNKWEFRSPPSDCNHDIVIFSVADKTSVYRE